ncbi:MAG: hypothetical protein ACLP59_18875 [Bryobacteraceae bacterium]
MNRCLACLLAVSFLPAVAAFAQPVIARSPVSSASYRAQGMPGSGIAQGSIFTIFGTGLGPSTLTYAYTFPLPINLGGATVAVTVGSTQVSAILLFAYDSQINAILPSTTPTGMGTITVTYGGQTSAPVPIQVVSSAFGIFTYSSSGFGQAIATDVNYNLNTIIHTFHPGDYAIIWGTGLGAITASDANPPPTGNLPTQIQVYVGNTAAAINYQGRSGCCAGLDQIVVQIPQGVTGCYVPVGVQAGGVLGNTGNIATIAISDSGNTCSDSMMGQDLITDLANGQNVTFGLVRLESWLAKYESDSSAVANEDVAEATFSGYTPGTAGLAEYGVSSGYCMAVDCTYGCGIDAAYDGSLTDASPAQLDAGSLSVQYAPIQDLQQAGGFYYGYLSSNGRYLWSDIKYPIVGAGGANIGQFSVTDVTGIPTATFTGIANTQNIPRSGDLTVQWTGGNAALQNGQVTIFAESYNQVNANLFLDGWLQCTAPQAAQQFTIPGWVLATLPVSTTVTYSSGGSYPGGWIQIGQYNTPTTFTATGLNKGMVTDIFYNGIGVFFQ